MNETTFETRRKYHVGTLQTDQELIDQFVVRQSELSIVLDTLRENIDADSCQHTLIVAPRGRGKTTLLVRVIAEIRSKPDLSEKLLPVRFMEESLEIFTTADFWLECLFYMAKEIEGNDPELASEFMATHTDLTGQWDQRDIENIARSAVLSAADRLNRQLVIIIENLQTLSDETDDDFGWGLRKILQSEKQIMLLASATSQFEGLDDPKAPYFEIFKQICLRPLDENECLTLWERVSGHKSTVHQIKPLKILTGGSPRLMVVIAEFGRNHSLSQLMEQLVNLIDDHTEYFRNHLEVIPTHERRVYISLIDLWQPSTANEIANRARMDIRKTSSLLTRLVKRGVILSEGSSKKRLYCVSERLYSIYYKLRRERDEATIVRNLIHFMSIFYSREEMGMLSNSIVHEAKQSLPIRIGVKQAVQEFPEIREIFAEHLELLKIQLDQVNEYDQKFGAIQKAYTKKDFAQVIRLADNYIDSLNYTLLPTKAHVLKCSALYEVGNIEELITTSEIFLNLSPQNYAKVYQLDVVSVLYFRGLGMATLRQYPKAIISFKQAIEQAGDNPHEKLMDIAAKSLFMCAHSYYEIANFELAIKYYQEVVTRYSNSQQDELQLTVAMALVTQAEALNTIGDRKAALKCLEVLINLYTDTQHTPLLIWVVESLFLRSVMYRSMGDSTKAINNYTELIDKYHNSTELEIQVKVVRSYLNRAQNQLDMGDSVAAISSYDEVIDRIRNKQEIELQVLLLSALNERGNLFSLKHDRSAIISFDEAINRFSNKTEPEYQEELAKTWLYRTLFLSRIGAYTESVDNNNELMNRFNNSANPNIQATIARSLIVQGENHDHLGSSTAAICKYDEVIHRFGESTDTKLQIEVARAYKGRAAQYVRLGMIEAALEDRDALITQYGDSDHLMLRIFVGQALIEKAHYLCFLHQPDEAISIARRIRKHYSNLMNSESLTFKWQISWVEVFVEIIRDNIADASNNLEHILKKIDLNNPAMLYAIQINLQSLVVFGIPSKDVLAILTNHKTLADTIQPLVIALKLESGEEVRAPLEMIAVAKDIQKQMSQHREIYNKGQATWSTT